MKTQLASVIQCCRAAIISNLGVLVARQIAGGGSIPCWSASKPQDPKPAERQRTRAKKKNSDYLQLECRFVSGRHEI